MEIEQKEPTPTDELSAQTDQDFALGYCYGLLLVEFESLRQQFETAFSCGDTNTANEMLPKLAVAERAVSNMHVRIVAKVRPIVNALSAERSN